VPRFFSNGNNSRVFLKWAELKFFTKNHQKNSQEFLKNKEVKRGRMTPAGVIRQRAFVDRVKGLQPATQLSAPPLCLPPPRHSPCSAPGFSSQFPFPPGVAPSSAVHLRSSQATWEVGVGAVVGLPG